MSNQVSSSLYFGNLDSSITERDLYDFIKKHAPEPVKDVESIKLVRDWNTGNSLGYAYVNIKNLDSSIAIQNLLNHAEIQSKKIRVYPQFQHHDEKYKKSNIFLRVGSGFSDIELDKLLSQYGHILSAKYDPLGKDNKFLKGFCQYEEESEANNAIENIDGKPFKDVIAKCAVFIPAKDREPKYNQLIVKNLPENVDVNMLSSEFNNVLSIYIYPTIHTINGENKKCANITFNSHEFAKAALEEKNGTKFNDSVLLIEKFKNKRCRHNEYPPGLNLYINHIPTDISEDKLRDIFGKHGEIVSLRLMVEPSGVSKGYGYCSFTSQDSAKNAQKQLNGYSFSTGHSIIVEMYKTSAERTKTKSQASPAPKQPRFLNTTVPSSKRSSKKYSKYPPKKANNKSQHQKPQAVEYSIEPISPEEFKTMVDDDKREQFGEKIYNYIEKRYPGINVGKITGMVLESYKNNYDTLNLIIENHTIYDKINEAINVFKSHENK